MMYHLSDEQLRKLELLDRLFLVMSVAQLTTFVEKEEVVARLAGTLTTGKPFSNLYNDSQNMQSELITLRAQVRQQSDDFNTLLRILNNSVFSQNQHGNAASEFYNLQGLALSRPRY